MARDVKYEIRNDEFVIRNYNNSKAFASFLPGVSGFWGKPMWFYYVNRGQAVSSFGIKDKSGAMLEFQAANKAYRYTLTQGFRTFLKVNGKFYEPFQDTIVKNPNSEQSMYVYSSGLRIEDINKKIGLKTIVEYFTLPNEQFPALVRKVTFSNLSDKKIDIECIDGLPMINPFGTPEFLLKNLSRLAEGWYQGIIYSEKHKAPIYKLAVEPTDDPNIVPINSGHFYFGMISNNGKTTIPEFIIDPDNLFANHHDFEIPVNFLKKEFRKDKDLLSKNKTPSAMGHFKVSIGGSKDAVYYSVVGHSFDYKKTDEYINVLLKKNYLELKRIENNEIIENIKNDMAVKSSSREFDNYTKQTYLDNVLRGGYPVTLNADGKNKINYYVYSRIHGDLEREYNNFMILPEYFSQGNGSYRDVNQNRRNDIVIHPNIGTELIAMLINLIQLDGFNPLRILGSEFYIKNKKNVLKIFKSSKDKNIVEKFIEMPFSLGSFFNLLEVNNIKLPLPKDKILNILIENAERMDKARADECYWSDHWHYNIDLIESYLSIFPENLKDLLFYKKDFVFYDNAKIVLPREDKYVLADNEKPRQLHAVITDKEKEQSISGRKINKNLVHTKNGKGIVYKTTLICKLLSIVANKYASLDPDGVGIEMESDKPNWCDALNGLPGIFGSSTAESLELKRLLQFLIDSLHKSGVSGSEKVYLPKEIWVFLNNLFAISNKQNISQFSFWDLSHTEKEIYRKETKLGVSGEEKSFKVSELIDIMQVFLKRVTAGLKKGFDKDTGVVITNFEYVPVKYSIIKNGGTVKKNKDGNPCIRISEFKRKPFPLFLEGPVHYMRIPENEKDILSMHANVLKSDLYDNEIKMFKNTGSLKNANSSLGRITVFTPGWLENESVFSHMEYKYLLELLRNNMSKEFFKYAKTCLIPFMNPEIYGRSIFENVSFIVSSAHPEKALHGRGFVSRLTGTTAEFISIWIAMTSGLKPFYMDNNKLKLEFSPQISAELFTKEDSNIDVCYKNGKKETFKVSKNSFAFKFMGQTMVTYINPDRKNLFPSEKYTVKDIKIEYHNGRKEMIQGKIIDAPYSNDIRDGKVKRIEINII